MLKVEDTKAVDIQKALQAAGIKVTSIIEVYKDKISDSTDSKSDSTDEETKKSV
jgi:hypothetical protein